MWRFQIGTSQTLPASKVNRGRHAKARIHGPFGSPNIGLSYAISSFPAVTAMGCSLRLKSIGLYANDGESIWVMHVVNRDDAAGPVWLDIDGVSLATVDK